MKRLAAVVVLLLLARSLASAAPAPAPPAPPIGSTDVIAPAPESRRSPLEPGSLGRGDVALGFGAGLGDKLFGFGGYAVVGLGGVDLAASVGFLPQYCIDLGDLGGGCDPALVLLGGGAQAELARTDSLRLGVRAHGNVSVTGDRTAIGSAGLVASTGSERLRVLAMPAIIGWYEVDDPFEENGWYAGGMLGVTYLSRSGGIELLGGAGAPISGQDDVMPMLQLSVFLRT
ncbi:MAG TPA: hypothetical protein VFQ53_35990 [Kofleriaceae bacterium]|nr:hypothetical protein [Kofleriaceae bacterium]